MTSASQPAILGGSPVRSRPYPPPNFIGPEERRLVGEVLDSGVLSDFIAHAGSSFLGGRMVRALEDEFCARFGVKHAVSVNSATSGLHAALAAGLVGLGDEVIVPPYTMSATATTVACCNATPVFADISPKTFCIDPDDVVRKLTRRTRAIVAVNLFGGPASLRTLREIADSRKIVLIEDNAQAPGARQDGVLTGTIGHMGVFSLNCHKTIQCGEGGVIITNDDTLADRMRLMRNHGEVVLAQRDAFDPEIGGMLGYNYRLTELSAAVALAQVRRLEELTVGRIEMADLLTESLRSLPGLTSPFVAEGDRHVYYLYAFTINAKELGLTRKQFKAALDAEGVATVEAYAKPIYLYPMYGVNVKGRHSGFGAGIWHPSGDNEPYKAGLCPVTERMYFDELMYTTICRADFGSAEAEELVLAITKVVESRQLVKAKLVANGIE